MNDITRLTGQLGHTRPTTATRNDIVDGEFRIHRRIDERIPLGYIAALFSLCCIIFGILLLVYCIGVAGLRY